MDSNHKYTDRHEYLYYRKVQTTSATAVLLQIDGTTAERYDGIPPSRVKETSSHKYCAVLY